eukprot:6018560-Amphidinium_carterae.2
MPKSADTVFEFGCDATVMALVVNDKTFLGTTSQIHPWLAQGTSKQSGHTLSMRQTDRFPQNNAGT